MANANRNTKPLPLLSRVVDELGALHAQISILQAKADGYKAQLIRSGESEINGKLFRATVSHVTREQFSAKLAKGLLSSAQIAECTGMVEFDTVSVKDLA